MSNVIARLPEYRKAVIAAVGAIVTIAAAFNVPVAGDLSQEVVGIFDALAAVLVLAVPNKPPAA